MEFIDLLVDGTALATLVVVGCYKLVKEFPDIATKYIDLYLKIRKL